MLSVMVSTSCVNNVKVLGRHWLESLQLVQLGRTVWCCVHQVSNLCVCACVRMFVCVRAYVCVLL